MVRRDHGTCCCVFPLKFGVALVAMYIFMNSLLCLLALFTGDIRMQGQGYSLTWYWVPPILGAFGSIFGFLGLLGVYDDTPSWLRIFCIYLLAKLFVMGITMVADYWVLYQCEGWLQDPLHTVQYSPQMYALASQGVCSWSRYSYIIGAGIDFAVNAYLTYCSVEYTRQISMNPPYNIDFGLDDYDVSGRWKLYHAKAPQLPPSFFSTERDVEELENPMSIDSDPWAYGTMEKQEALDGIGHFGPDGMPLKNDKLPFTPAGGDYEREASARQQVAI